ncbi:MAG: response regulator [Thermodesulfovibrionia bacterium]
MKGKHIRILLVDDEKDDYVIIRDLLTEIEGTRYDIEWTKSYDAALETVERNEHDVYLFDYRLGKRTGLELLREAIARGCRPPIILITGQGDHDVDIEAMKTGAFDYMVKGEISAPLLERSIRYAIEHKRAEIEREKIILELQDALAKVKTLSGLLPICASCKKIRDDKGYWNQIEAYIAEHSDAEFSHGICPGCAKKIYPKFVNSSE